MQPDNNQPEGKTPKGKTYPVKHRRPHGQIIERGPERFMVWVHSHTDEGGRKKRYSQTWRTLKHKGTVEEYRRKRGDRWQDNALVFPNQTGEPLYQYLLSNSHATIFQFRIGVPSVYLWCTSRRRGGQI